MREAVGSLRAGGLELSGALEVLVGNIPELKVHLELSDDLRVDDPGRALALLRVVQEIVTNTVRHARAAPRKRPYRDAGACGNAGRAACAASQSGSWFRTHRDPTGVTLAI